MELFDSTKRSLYELLKDVHSGKIQLPDFQRGWIWDDNRIRGILASVAKSFPIGAIMLLETGNNSVKFKTKYVEGVKLNLGVKPERLILDGQQRITSLYQAIITNEIVTTRNDKGYEIKRWYYIDMQKAMDNNYDLEEAIISLNENKQITKNIGRDIVLDLSKEEYEYQNLMYPVCMIDEYSTWRMNFTEYWNYDKEKSIFWNSFEAKIINSFNHYMLPVIDMKKENSKEAVCQVFEKVNTGGVPLTVFELLTATYASDEFDLKQDWKEILQKFGPYDVLQKIKNTDFIQTVTLLSTYYNRSEPNIDDAPAVSCKRKDMLNLSLDSYRKYRDKAVNGFIKAAKLLISNHIYKSRDIPYTTQMIPMAAILSDLGDKIGNKDKFMRWYWCGVLGELYGSANETRYALDLPQVLDFMRNNGKEPNTIYDANFAPSRLHTLRTRNSAAYKGIYALLLDEGTKDWLSATTIDFSNYYSEGIDIHHIFPVAWCIKNNKNEEDYNCIINKTPLSGRTNRFVGGDAPSKYLDRIKKHAGVDDQKFNDILETHVLDVSHLYDDNFEEFFKDRKERILQRIEKAIGKQILRDSIQQEEGTYINNDEIENI
ncbi:MAG TPA: DUF262 domain-containing protein [Candidatus Eremiobacteraeota bacterium]|nr:MAG: hypothetical protein BWY64_03145 [bacterium ADurb.Bin363]HPZ06613.1 DUF262 domain-containing protein [Candidatus Eremiobacteraeota bacterium]